LAFSSDGRWLAVGGEDRRATIYDMHTFQEVLRLPPQNSFLYDLAFQPGGSALAVGGAEERLTVWDLDQVESALAGVGLGCRDAPPAPVAGTPQGQPLSLLSWVRGCVERHHFIEGTIWLLQQVLETDSDQPEVCMELAWIRVMGPEEFRDASKALPLARRAVELAPGHPLCLNTLGVVYYRLGRWKEAAETLQASARANPEDPTAYDLFFLAMTYQQIGELEKAKACYDQAVWWCRARAELQPDQVAELRAIRAEADEIRALLTTSRPARGRSYADRGE
jgi:tetratricopeptide (TPR) repeat protein